MAGLQGDSPFLSGAPAPSWARVKPPPQPQFRTVFGTDPIVQSEKSDGPSESQQTKSTQSSPRSTLSLEQLYQQWRQDPSPQNTDRVLQALTPLIRQQVSRHSDPQDKVLMGRARLLALRALRSYDPQGKATLTSHVYSHLQSLFRESQRLQQPIAVPERAALEWKRIQAAETTLIDQLGRPPTDRELADHLQMSQEKLARLRRMRLPVPTGQFQSLGEDGLSSHEPAVEIQPQRRNNLTWSILLDELDPVNRKIAEMTLGWNGQPQVANQDIARKLGVTPGAVSQRKAEIQRKFQDLHYRLWGY